MFNPLAGQIDAATFFFSKEAALPSSAMTRRWAPQTRYTLRRKSVSAMRI